MGLEDEFLTKKEVAKLLKVSEVTIYRWSKQGILKPIKIGKKVLFKRADIEKLLNESYKSTESE
ncbi:helix-turn-helix domain-containing protein [Marinitoga piezophila]|uniref:helix-turn-helix domain-containing protein n=1 Tax=Marinitoga piezophila TaxID=149715 RepID=UPI00031550E2|nr:helix-turn-helix domain-containing protein [Marinitoga piezophila]